MSECPHCGMMDNAPVDTVEPVVGLEVDVVIKALTISDRIAGFGLMVFTGFAIALFGRAGLTLKQGPEIDLKISKHNALAHRSAGAKTYEGDLKVYLDVNKKEVE